MSTLAKIFIDGEVGTTGLQIAARLGARADIELLQIDPAQRKDTGARAEALNAADIAILCLPDAAAREAVALVENTTTRIIDASTAHRTSDGWVYGFPEFDVEQRARMQASTRISNPGCYAIAAVSILRPLLSAGLLPTDWPVSIHGMSGYSGGGKSLIAAFESGVDGADPISATTYDYALNLDHKHVAEITRWSGLSNAPIFLPAVGRYYKGMLVHVPLPLWALPQTPTPTPHDVFALYRSYYADQRFVTVANFDAGQSFSNLDPEGLNDSNELRLHLLHNAASGQVIVVGQLDNLGKGASGQVVQTVNLLLGVDEGLGL
jgi:N-acetyl-gamma-glutamyl-phosphate reductase